MNISRMPTLLYQLRLFSTIKQVGSKALPELPQFRINPEALRPALKEDKDLTIRQFQAISNLTTSNKQIPQCRYYAVQHKNRIYHVFNAYCYPMGRMINKVSTAIRGRNSPLYRNSIADIKKGDICVIVNAADPLFTGKKLKYKELKYHTNFVGHLKTFSYRGILNKKPELLYYYLLRKAMPKNKLSEKYLQNLKIYRGPNHDIPGLPQFMPPKQLKTPLASVDLKKFIQESKSEDVTIEYETEEGLTEKMFNRSFNKREYPEPDKSLDTDEKLQDEPQIKKVSKYSAQQIQKMVRKQKRILERYKEVRAPYKKQNDEDPGYKFYYSEKQAKKSPYYEELADEETPEDDDFKIDDPLLRKGFDKDD